MTRPALHSLGGHAAPEEVERDLALILELPPSAKARLWEALGPCLVDPIPDALETRLDAFCKRHDAPAELLARALKACRFLVWQAAGRGLPRDAFAADLANLHPSTELAELLLAGYDAAKTQVRRELVRGALLDHGSVLEAVDWRLDSVVTSSRGGLLREPVAVLTLRYRAGAAEERLTLHLVPETLRQLHQACESLAAAAKRTA